MPLLVLSILAAAILLIWMRNGAGNRSSRNKVAGITIALLAASWVALLSFGVFHPIGSWGMAFGFIVSIAAFFVPMVYNKVHSNEHT